MFAEAPSKKSGTDDCCSLSPRERVRVRGKETNPFHAFGFKAHSFRELIFIFES
jgi:hypothetical protein